MELRELATKEEMLANYAILNEFYPTLTLADYDRELDLMIPHNYGQVAVYDGDTCAGVSGYWIGSKLWCGKYLEFDNVVVSQAYRRKGIGKMIFAYLRQKAIDEGCTMMALDSYVENKQAHKFFEAEGFYPKGYHFVHVLDREKIR